jgi:hypothetical protein
MLHPEAPIIREFSRNSLSLSFYKNKKGGLSHPNAVFWVSHPKNATVDFFSFLVYLGTMKNKRMVSVSQFLDEITKCGGSSSRSDLLTRWKNGAMSSDHLDALIKEAGCICHQEATRGRPKTMVSLPS